MDIINTRLELLLNMTEKYEPQMDTICAAGRNDSTKSPSNWPIFCNEHMEN